MSGENNAGRAGLCHAHGVPNSLVVSVVSLIRPTPRFWMPTRKRALGGIGVAFGFFVLTAIIMPKPDNAKPEGGAPKLQAAVSSEAAFKPEVKEEKK